MKLFCLDTSSSRLCAGLTDGPSACECSLDLHTRLSGLLVPCVQRMFDAAGRKIEETDYFACGAGPGSFTALRIGMAAMKAWAWSCRRPVAALCSLDILAANALAYDAEFVLPLIDAKRKLVYCALYRRRGGTLARISANLLLDEQGLLRMLAGRRQLVRRGRVCLLGDGLPVVGGQATAALDDPLVLDRDHWQLRSEHLIRAAREAIRQKKYTDALRLKPLYLYPKECQIRR